MMSTGHVRVCAMVLLLAASAVSTVAAAFPPIRTPGDLQQHLVDAGERSPLHAMPVGARQRFMASVRFGANGVGGFSIAELGDTLTAEQIAAVLSLFGAQEFAAMIEGLPARREPREFLTEFEHRFNVFDSALGDDASEAYRALLGGSDPATLVRSLDSYDRLLLYRAMLEILQHGDSAAIALDARRVLTSLHEAGVASKAHVTGLHDALVTRRQFAAASDLGAQFPDAALPPLPRYVFEAAAVSGSTALQISADGAEMRRVEVPLDHGLRIVVIAGCHFSRDAALAIAQDPPLDRLFRRHSAWIAPSSQSLVAAAAWNREFPGRPMLVAWSAEDWPQIASWDMPTFMVFRDGTLLRSWSGWPSDTGMAMLRAELSAAGVEY